MTIGSRRIGIWGCVLLASVVVGCDQADRDEIRQVHAAWDQAFLDRDGERYVELLAIPALEYYGRILNYAQLATRQQVLQSPPVERFQILIVRQMLTREHMAQLDARSFVVLTINEGWFDPDELWKETITDIRFSGSNVASAELVLDGFRTKARYGFIRQDGLWKVDDTLLDQVYNQDIEKEAAYFGMTENEFILDWVKGLSGKDVQDSIWDPPK